MSKFNNRVTEIVSAIRGIKQSLVMSRPITAPAPPPAPPPPIPTPPPPTPVPTPPPPVVVPEPIGCVPTDLVVNKNIPGISNATDEVCYLTYSKNGGPRQTVSTENYGGSYWRGDKMDFEDELFFTDVPGNVAFVRQYNEGSANISGIGTDGVMHPTSQQPERYEEDDLTAQTNTLTFYPSENIPYGSDIYNQLDKQLEVDNSITITSCAYILKEVVVPVEPQVFLFGTQTNPGSKLTVELVGDIASVWSLRDVLSDTVLTDNLGVYVAGTTSSGFGGNNLSIFLAINGTREFELTGTFNYVVLAADYSGAGDTDGESNTLNRLFNEPNHLIIRRFSETITNHAFQSQYWSLTVPDELPSYVTSMNHMFSYAKHTPDNIALWDVSHVTRMVSTFSYIDDFNIDLSNWNVGNVTDMYSMFRYNNWFNQDISSWDVSQVTNMSYMFTNCLGFNQDLSNWDVSNVTNMYAMFNLCRVFNANLALWNVSNVTDMGHMFYHANGFNQDISGWDVGKVTNMSYMFYDAKVFNQDISSWDVSNVENMGGMFFNCLGFNQDLSNWCVRLVPEKPDSFDANISMTWTQPQPQWGICPRNEDGLGLPPPPPAPVPTPPPPVPEQGGSLTGLAADYPGTGWYKATDTGTVFCKGVPKGETKRFEEGGIEYVSVYTKEDAKLHSAAAATSNITDMYSLFVNDTTFNQDISSWDTSNVTTMGWMFYGCVNFNQDIGNWDTSNVTKMDSMFCMATSFNQDLSKWNVSNVTDMTNMFKETSYFNSDIGNWNTSNVTKMDSMFHTCTLFNQDIGGWDTSNVTDMRAMFNKCRDFNQDIGGWNVSNVTRTGMSYMFDAASSFNQDLSGWNVSNIASLPMNFNANQSGLSDVNLPLWGTNGVKVQHAQHESFGFRNVDDDDNTLTVKMAIAKPVANWKLYASDVLIADSEGRTSPLVTFTQNEEYVFVTVKAKTIHSGYNLVTQSTYLEVILLDNGQGKLEVTDYSNTIAQCRFVANTIPLTVTASLPPNITTTALMFYGCSKFNSPLDHWNTSNVTNMQAMFSLCTSFNQDISNWDVSNVTNTTFMFNGCSKFNSPLNTWDVSKVVVATSMFKECIVFNQPLNLWNTSSLVSADSMFKLAAKFNQDLSNWDMSKVTHTDSMFESATLFNGDLSTWDTSNVINMSFMFFGNVNFNQDIGGWNVSKVTDIANMKSMFNRAVSFNQDLSAWDVSRLSREPDYFKYNNTVWVKSKPLWGQSPITNLAWSISDITVIEDAVDVNATKRTNGMNYSSAIRYTPSASEIKEGMVTDAAAPLIDHILNKLIGQVTSWSFDVDNNRITYN